MAEPAVPRGWGWRIARVGFRLAMAIVYGVALGAASAVLRWRDPLRLRRKTAPAWHPKPRVTGLWAWARRPF